MGGRIGDDSNAIDIEQISINDMIAKLDRPFDLLKIDCEGGEFAIFEAMTPESASQIRRISMEVHDVEAFSRDYITHRLQQLRFSVRVGYPTVAWYTKLDNPTEAWLTPNASSE